MNGMYFIIRVNRALHRIKVYVIYIFFEPWVRVLSFRLINMFYNISRAIYCTDAFFIVAICERFLRVFPINRFFRVFSNIPNIFVIKDSL